MLAERRKKDSFYSAFVVLEKTDVIYLWEKAILYEFVYAYVFAILVKREDPFCLNNRFVPVKLPFLDLSKLNLLQL